MIRAEAQARHATLVVEIRAHDHAYDVEARPALSDREYDRLLAELLCRGVCFSTLGEIADEVLNRPETIPRCALEMGELPGRAGLVATQL